MFYYIAFAALTNYFKLHSKTAIEAHLFPSYIKKLIKFEFLISYLIQEQEILGIKADNF